MQHKTICVVRMKYETRRKYCDEIGNGRSLRRSRPELDTWPGIVEIWMQSATGDVARCWGRRLTKRMIMLSMTYAPCGNKLTKTNLFKSKKSISIDLVARIVWRALWGNSSLIVIDGPVGGSRYMILQNSAHAWFSVVVVVTGKRSSCYVLLTFWLSDSKWNPWPMMEPRPQYVCQDAKRTGCAWPRHCIEQM
jgi:hypothetical protein